ncbi:MAG: YqgE/AlgH family protein [Planctomycetota bacterium]|nr:MAG: YqgE/AlgH family protein [Planctomycetota bacterium]
MLAGVSADLQPGVLLLADPSLTDSNFEGSVVLLCAHGAEGSLGLVLNRPLDFRVDQVLEDPGPFQGEEAPMLWGGPVGLDRLHVLHAGAAGAHSFAVCAGVTFGGAMQELLRLHQAGAPVRFFLGYSGWDAGQLESELQADSWRVVPATAEEVFDARVESLWRRLMAAQDARYHWMRHASTDPRAN